MPTIDATVGGASANSFETLAEATTYFDNRTPITPAWVASGDPSIRLLLTATRMLSAMAQPRKTLVPAQGGEPAYYRIARQWTGRPATATQALPWPRIGMFDANGNEIPSDVIPQALKDAESELGGYLLKGDLSQTNDVVAQGVTSVRAGSVSVVFKNNIVPQTIPQFVYDLMPLSWFTDELYEPALAAEFCSVPTNSRRGSRTTGVTW